MSTKLRSTLRLLVISMCAVCSLSYSSDINSHIPQEFEVILPVVFHYDEQEGIPPTTDVYTHLKNRRRRSLSSDIFINITTDNEEFHIQLTQNHKLLAPGFKVYHRHPSRSSSQNDTDDVITETDDITDGSDVDMMSQCLFKGKVLSHDDAPAAFSLCNGVTGVLMFPHDDYVIEPLPAHMADLQRHGTKHQNHHSNTPTSLHDNQHHHSNAPTIHHDNENHHSNKPTSLHENADNQNHSKHRHYENGDTQRRRHQRKHDHSNHDNTYHKTNNSDHEISVESMYERKSYTNERDTRTLSIHDSDLDQNNSSTNVKDTKTLSIHDSYEDSDVDPSILDSSNSRTFDIGKPESSLRGGSKYQSAKIGSASSKAKHDLDTDDVSKTDLHGNSVNSDSLINGVVTDGNIGDNVLSDTVNSDLNDKFLHGIKQKDEANVFSTGRHLLYKRSALPRHRHKNNYQMSEDFNNYAKLDGRRSKTRRKKRSYETVGRSVETLVVVDRDMFIKHGRQNVTTYVLSIFNIVSQLYQDTTLGYPINVVLVGLVFLDGREPGLHITNHADKTLNSFCAWQAGVHNGRQKLHDHAVLLTGKDICSYQNAPCDTLGFAPIDGMCSELRSCIVNEDTGLSTAFTVAHEMGHNFGMMHDGDGNDCKDTSGYIMSPTLAAQGGTFHWSPCSRQYMRKFLNAVQSECLTSQSQGTAELKFPNKLPGEIFDADTQCKWQFGSHSKQCTIMFGKDPCVSLFCHKREGMCETKFLPAAEGTSCGPGRWCKQARCVSYGRKGPNPIHGWWTEWGSWSACTRSCGGGIKTRTRECNNPRPQYGGKTCTGPEVIHKMCNLLECEQDVPDFREQQCKQLAQESFRGWNYRWRSYREYDSYETEDECKLYCKADGYNFYYTMPREVTDGTRCNDYTTDVCVQGKCQRVGCDLVVGSEAHKDRCGVCQGNNSTCKIVENTFTAHPPEKGYFGVVFLPRGSSSIEVAEVEIARSNYLALRDSHGNYHLNGNWKLNGEGVYDIGGTKFVYRRPYNSPESLTAKGPLLEDLVLEALLQSENPGIRYSFMVSKQTNHLPPAHNYTWRVTLTECSQACAGGEQIVTAHCHRDQGEEVDPGYCVTEQKPATGKYTCNTAPCRPRWAAQPWSVCHKECGGGKQKRKVYCIQRMSTKEDRKLPRKFCDRESKPQKKRECNTQECPPVWYKGSWSQCSATCGKGLKSRTVVCRSKTLGGQVVLPDSMCSGDQRPVQHNGCRNVRCPDPTAQWTVTSWTECSATCGKGRMSRAIKCTRKTQSDKAIITHDKKCHHLDPLNVTLTQMCDLEACPMKTYWYASPWSQCSVTCGSGTQTRLVHCMHQEFRRLSHNCDDADKPVNMQNCLTKPCESPGPDCGDEFSWCHLVPKHNICDHEFYGTKCCRSCYFRR
ncbi:A disintegrin and metalloproteinase with thrombospondin motifs 16-like [Mya arenaria]|uniref:A disintegrin and metalloproteinase with thrombospondin motifs 16-like n=1 Tax=Mya arenaria TaxID=6604 RepID=UPI0022E2C891|nr:A disintegrin and metalloproteinase with thrombospondin motifs 16-like [Mya arenaria]